MANPDQAKIIAKAWSDDAFRQKLLSDPRAALHGEGFDVPAGVNVHVHEQSASNVHIVIPQKPGSGQLSEDELESAAGGGSTSVKACVKGLTTK